MKGKTVEQSDLVGALKEFPIEVVQEMVNEQVMQGNNANVEVFQERVHVGRICGGFDWVASFMGATFWEDVLCRNKFDLFFQKYPKKQYSAEPNSFFIEIPDGYEVDKDKSTFTKIVFKPIEPKYPKSWNDAFINNTIRGYWIGSQGDIRIVDRAAVDADKNVFKTEKQAKSALAYAQITQLMALPCYNGDWTPDWAFTSPKKYCPRAINGSISYCHEYTNFNHIAFKDYDTYESFLKNHEDLLRQYFQID